MLAAGSLRIHAGSTGISAADASAAECSLSLLNSRDEVSEVHVRAQAPRMKWDQAMSRMLLARCSNQERQALLTVNDLQLLVPFKITFY